MIAQENALQVFNDKEKLEPFLEKIRATVLEYKPDLTTKKGRDDIASFAYKVSTKYEIVTATVNEFKDNQL